MNFLPSEGKDPAEEKHGNFEELTETSLAGAERWGDGTR